MKPMRILFLLAFVASLSTIPPPALAAPTDAEQITHAMKATWDKPDNPLTVTPVVIAGDYALAGWAQGDGGGRALLRRKDGAWRVHVCGGDALKSASTLEQVGISKAQARKLAGDLARAEARLAPDLVRKFALFEGLVKVEGQADHNPHAHHPN